MNENKKSWIQSKAFYGVVAALILAIAGIATAIYNVANVKDRVMSENDSPSVYTAPRMQETTEHQANLNATGVPDDRTTTTEEKSNANDLNRPYSGYYLLPLNSKITQDYSNGEMVYSQTMGDWRTHDGIDIGGNVGDNVIAIQDGKVTDAYTDDLWGGVVIIEHGNGLTAKYCGVAASVKNGDKIEQGQVIGTLADIPVEAESKHVHLETVVDGKGQDPVKVMNLLNDEPTTE